MPPIVTTIPSCGCCTDPCVPNASNCCCDTLPSKNLRAKFTGTCPIFDGLDFPLSYDPFFKKWQAFNVNLVFPVLCWSQFNFVFSCNGGEIKASIDGISNPNPPVVCIVSATGPVGCVLPQPYILQCTPFKCFAFNANIWIVNQNIIQEPNPPISSTQAICITPSTPPCYNTVIEIYEV
jgi:hypothetical protein